MSIFTFRTAALLMTPFLNAAEFPQAEISNGLITAKMYLPDPERGYYRGTRFDWSGQIYSLRAFGNEYFGQWFERYDPKLHDAIMGPVEDFRTGNSALGYEEVPAGGIFYRIGVGALRKPDEKPFHPFRTYDIVDPGNWSVSQKPGEIEFVHVLSSKDGYGWRYRKTIRLVNGEHRMLIEHSLKNTGSKPIDTEQYNHNFFVMNSQPTGPGVTVTFPFSLKPIKPFPSNSAASFEGGRISYNTELQKGQQAAAQFEGAPQYRIELEHAQAGAGVRIEGDRPIQKIVFWSIRSTFCPEPYIDVSAGPAAESQWTYTYTFYRLPSDKEK